MRAIVNVAVDGNYLSGQKRLTRSLNDIGEKAARLFFDYFPGRLHSEIPYGFKVDAFRIAQQSGFSSVLWLDASCWVKRPLDEAWDQIERDGYLLGQEGWSVGQWINDEVLAKSGYSREQALEITLMEGKFIGLDVTSDVGREFLDRWEDARNAGWFNGEWHNHRHDITAGALVAHEMGLKLTPHVIAIPRKGDAGPPETYCYAEGL